MLGSAFISGLSSGKAKNFGGNNASPAEVLGKTSYFVFLAYRFWKRSTRPAVSTNFCVPVKKGWHFEQMPMRMSFRVERVLRIFPHAQWITASTYSGCILAFMSGPRNLHEHRPRCKSNLKQLLLGCCRPR